MYRTLLVLSYACLFSMPGMQAMENENSQAQAKRDEDNKKIIQKLTEGFAAVLNGWAQQNKNDLREPFQVTIHGGTRNGRFESTMKIESKNTEGKSHE